MILIVNNSRNSNIGSTEKQNYNITISNDSQQHLKHRIYFTYCLYNNITLLLTLIILIQALWTAYNIMNNFHSYPKDQLLHFVQQGSQNPKQGCLSLSSSRGELNYSRLRVHYWATRRCKLRYSRGELGSDSSRILDIFHPKIPFLTSLCPNSIQKLV
jgi:hypothetical protein